MSNNKSNTDVSTFTQPIYYIIGNSGFEFIDYIDMNIFMCIVILFHLVKKTIQQ